MKPYFSCIAFIAIVVASPLHAKDWQAMKGSTLSFTSSFQGESFTGEFKRFTPQIRFDPQNPAQGRFDVLIELASADTRNTERDDTLKTGDFFDVGKFATAKFTAVKFTALAAGKFKADGQLTMRGITKPIALVFNWQPGQSGQATVLSGEAVVNRLDFKVGTGDWSDTELLPNAVKVKTRLMLAPKALAKP
jgi:polyisoprenoid-binding protein YceI